MSCRVEWREHQLLLSNRHFSDLISFAIEVSRRTLRTDDERMFVDRMVQLSKDEFWPGRGIQIENDFPDIEERKF